MASPAEKRKEYSYAAAAISYATGENQQRSRSPFVKTSIGTGRNCWVCNDVWMDLFPLFDHAQLGLKLALLSPRFDALVDTHFDGKSELTIWKWIKICKGTTSGTESNLFVGIGANFVPFPLPDHSLHNKIRFKSLQIEYIDHSVLAFLRANQQIWDKGTNLCLSVPSCFHDGLFSFVHNAAQPIWDVLSREIWPIFGPNISRLDFRDGYYLDNLRRRTSPTILTDLNTISVIISGFLLPDPICDDGPNATAGQALSKWLHTPRKDGQPKRLRCCYYMSEHAFVNVFKEKFIRATTSASYEIHFFVYKSTPIEPFELVNKRTNEKLILIKAKRNARLNKGIMKRYPIGNSVAVPWGKNGNLNNLNNVSFMLCDAKRCNGANESEYKAIDYLDHPSFQKN